MAHIHNKQFVYIGYYKHEGKLKIGETCRNPRKREKELENFKILWFAELSKPNKKYGLEVEQIMREYFQNLSTVEQISTDHFQIKNLNRSRYFVQDEILDLVVYLREQEVQIKQSYFVY